METAVNTGNTGENSTGQPPTSISAQTSTEPSMPTSQEPKEEGDVGKLLSALEKEREARRNLERQLRERNQAEQRLQADLERYKSIDPEQYQKLLKEQAAREEQDLIRRKEFDKLKDQYRGEAEGAQKVAKEWEARHNNLVLETAVRTAFFENGGKRSTFDLSQQGGEDVPPVEAIMAVLKPKLKLEGEKVVILNSVGAVELTAEGRPKTLTEKMMEFRKGSMGSLFEPENNNAGSGMVPTITNNGKSVRVFSKEQARNGNASIDDIASGKAFVN